MIFLGLWPFESHYFQALFLSKKRGITEEDPARLRESFIAEIQFGCAIKADHLFIDFILASEYPQGVIQLVRTHQNDKNLTPVPDCTHTYACYEPPIAYFLIPF